MTQRDSLSTSWVTSSLVPVGAKGLDLASNPATLPQGFLALSENLRLEANDASSRPGAKKVARIVTAGASKTFGADTSYATIPAATQLVLGAGGWALRWSGTAVRPSAGQTGFILGSRPASVAYHILSVTISDAGVITVAWRDSGGTTRTVTTTAQTSGGLVHLLAVYDAPAGTFTVYINGAASGTPLTGLSSSLGFATNSTDWIMGVEKQTGAAVTANTHFDGAYDSLTLFALVGTRPSEVRGDRSIVTTLVEFSRQQWPNPTQDMVIFNYDMDGTSLTTLTDSSWFKNDATVTGTITDTTEAAYLAAPCCAIGQHEDVDGALWNVVEQGGVFAYEKVRASA